MIFNRGNDDGFATRQKLREQFYFIESTRDFLEWLFDYEVDWMTQTEAWEKFEAWQNKETDDKTERRKDDAQ